MSKKRTQHSSEFKAKIVLEAIRGDETIPICQLVMGYISYRSIVGNGHSLNKQLSYFPEILGKQRERINYRRFTPCHPATDSRTRFLARKLAH